MLGGKDGKFELLFWKPYRKTNATATATGVIMDRAGMDGWMDG